MARLPHCSAAEVQRRLAADEPARADNKDLSEYPLGERNIFRVLAHNPPLLRAFVRWVNALWQVTGLDDRETELVVLTVAAVTGSRYEWHRHVQLAREAGLTDGEITAIADADDGPFTEREGTLLRFVRSALENDVNDDLFAAVRDHYSPEQVVGVVWLTGTYVGLGVGIDALGVEPERPFLGWHPD